MSVFTAPAAAFCLRQRFFFSVLLVSILVSPPLGRPSPLSAGELHADLRQASELYRNDCLDEARALAVSIHRAYPDDFAALLLLIRIDVARHDHATARNWLRLATRSNPTHPLVLAYMSLFREEDHRRSVRFLDPAPEYHSDPMASARSFRRAWFGPISVLLFPRWPLVPPPEPMFTLATSSRLLASLAQSATEAQNQGLHRKAYLLFRQLTREAPNNAQYRFGLAVAAHSLQQYSEARTLLIPLERLPAGGGLRKDQQAAVQALQQDIVQKLSLPIPPDHQHID